MDTEQFQRLRYISQLSFVNHVYPSAMYSRFEHSIGTFHLASELIKLIQQQIINENLDINLSDEDIKCVEIAALCHDLGHGPYSHLWEQAVVDNLNTISGDKHKTHEELSCEILSDVLKVKKVKDAINFDSAAIDRTSRMILGKYDKQKDSNKKFLFEIVANKESGLDVDKFDYLSRDVIYLGWSNKNKIDDIKRIVHFTRVLEYKSEWRLAMRDREIFNIHDIFYCRHMLFRYGHQHKTVKALDCMFKNAMGKIVKDNLDEFIDNVMGQRGIKKQKYDEMFLCSKDFISKCCDFHVWSMMCKYSPDIVHDINERNLYKLYCKMQIRTKDETVQIDYKELKKSVDRLENLINGNLKMLKIKYKCVNMALSNFTLRSENKGNPISLIPFYEKRTPNIAFIFDNIDNHPPALVNLVNDDYVLSVYTDDVVKPETTIGVELNSLKNKLLEPSGTNDALEEIEDLLSKYKFNELKY